jgi:tripartite-type tricarboxylate transporter receptor subunit TctC
MTSTPFPFRPDRRRALCAAAGAAAALAAPAVRAQPLSDRPVRILVGAPAGGTADLLARVVAEPMSKRLGQPVIVDNRPGALGAIVMDAFLGAPRDGHTLLLSVNGLFTEIPHTIKPKYDPVKDVRPIVELAGSGLVLVGHPGVPARTLAELVAWVRANPGKVNFASYTAGTISHVLGLQLNALAGLDMQHVAYKGSPPALQDVMGGQVPLMFDGPATSVPNLRAGKLRAFAVSAPARSGALPDVPTFAESGFPAMTRTAWLGLFSTPDAPAPAQQRLRDEALAALALPAVRERLTTLGLEVETVNPRTPEQLSRSIEADHRSIGETLRSVGYRPSQG